MTVGEAHSRRSFLTGALISGGLAAVANAVFVDDRQPAGREPVRLTLASGTDPTRTRDRLIQIWNELNPAVQIRPLRVAGSTRDQLTAFRDSGADLLNLDLIHLPAFAADGPVLRRLPRPERLTFLGNLLDACRVDGTDELWAWPFNADVGMLFRRRPVDGLAGVLAEAVPGRPDFVGQLAHRSADEEAFVVNVLEHGLAQDGGLYDERAGQWTFDRARWSAALLPLRRALAGRAVLAQPNEDETAKSFRSGGLAYMRNWPARYGMLGRDRKAVEVVPLPHGILGGQFLAVSGRCAHPTEAEQVLRFLTGDAAQQVLAVAGFAPTRAAVYNSAQIRGAVPHLELLREAVDNARPRPASRDYATFSELFAGFARAFLADGEQLPATFASELEATLR